MFKMVPEVSIYDLEDAVNERFGTKIAELASLLWGEMYTNDSLKRFHFDKDEVFNEKYVKYSWYKPEEITLRNYVRQYLREMLPDYDEVVIDVSW